AFLEITVLQAPLNAFLVDLDAEDRGVRHAPGERLRAAHAAEPRGENEAPAELALEMFLGDARENFVGALDHALRADVLPVARGEPAPADQVLLGKLVEHFGFRPLPDEIAVRHEDE